MTVATWWRKIVPLCVAACLLTSGCHRRAVVPTLPPVVQSPEEKPPTPKAPAMEGPPPESVMHAPRVKVVETKPAKRQRRSQRSSSTTANTVSAAPVETATVNPPSPPASVVGALTTGGEVSPQAQQETADLIAADERRLQVVAGTKARDQLTQLKEVRHFLDQAKEALASGDAGGGKTLATKAKLLLDDLEKWAEK